jgi:5-(carboxyamino)imidazole ribonucleotide synthase
MNYKPKQKLGILGGGQLGRMLIQSLINYDVDVFILDPDKDAPCKDICKKFTVGSLMDADAIIEFGRELDIITIEIEHVNVAGLYELQKMGKTIIPSPESIETIQDKGLQKLFYKKHDIPSADFIITDTINDVKNNVSFLPAFQKMRKNGYDGKGVKYLKDNTDGAFEEASLLEIAIIIVVNKDGEIKDFPLVELVFNPEYNLVDYLICPSDIVASKQEEAKQIALSVAKALNSPGIFAIEMFLTKTGEILVNETAPRTHNSGHQSIEGNYTSQFEQQARALLNLPLGNTVVREKSLMMNIIGEKEQEGDVQYQDFNEIVQLENVFVHLYGKKITKPGRKMGHITILGKTENELIEKYSIIRNKLKVIKQ